MVIETERLKIRDIALSDEKTFGEMASDGSLNDVDFDRNCSSWMKGWIIGAQNLAQKDNPRTDYLVYVIEYKRTGFSIGAVGCSFCEDMRKVGITYFVRADFWGKGYAIEAAKACKKYAFEILKADEVCSIIRDTNTASQNVAIKNGMSRKDTWIKHYRGVDMLHYRYVVHRR